MAVAKDQNGCRFLQRKFDEGGPAAIQAVLPEVLEHLIELMMDPFGNYLIQKLLDRCSEDQRLAVTALLLSVCSNSSSLCNDLPLKIRALHCLHMLESMQSVLQVLKKAAERKELVQVALNTHGTRAVQKLIETLTSREQVIPHIDTSITALFSLGLPVPDDHSLIH